jgi:type IV pilus assembly protein PilX
MKLSSRNRSAGFHRPRRDTGAVLIIALIMLLVMTLIGISMSRAQRIEERMAQNDENHKVAVESAEAALRMAELGLLDGTYSDFAVNATGLYHFDPAVGNVYPDIDWSDEGATLSYSGPEVGAAQPPTFIIEQLPPVAAPGESVSECGYGCSSLPVEVFRVTSRSVGGDQTATAELQSIFR